MPDTCSCDCPSNPPELNLCHATLSIAYWRIIRANNQPSCAAVDLPGIEATLKAEIQTVRNGCNVAANWGQTDGSDHEVAVCGVGINGGPGTLNLIERSGLIGGSSADLSSIRLSSLRRPYQAVYHGTGTGATTLIVPMVVIFDMQVGQSLFDTFGVDNVEISYNVPRSNLGFPWDGTAWSSHYHYTGGPALEQLLLCQGESDWFDNTPDFHIVYGFLDPTTFPDQPVDDCPGPGGFGPAGQLTDANARIILADILAGNDQLELGFTPVTDGTLNTVTVTNSGAPDLGLVRKNATDTMMYIAFYPSTGVCNTLNWSDSNYDPKCENGYHSRVFYEINLDCQRYINSDQVRFNDNGGASLGQIIW